MRRKRAVLALLALLGSSGAEASDLPVLPGVGQSDGRRVLDVDRPPWQIVGRVQTDLAMKCTGFLVAPNVIQTAAHCLWIGRTGRYIAPQSVHFLLGYQRGRFRAAARGIRIVVASGYDPKHGATPVGADRAAIVLDHPLATRDALLPVVLPVPGQDAMLAGYEQDRREVLSGDVLCHVVAVRDATVEHDCNATRGASGAPLFVRVGSAWGIAGLDSRARDDGGGVAARLD